jgi:hypothetical protein
VGAIWVLMRSYRVVLHRLKVPLSALLLILGVVLMALSAYSYPSHGVTRKSAPLGSLRGLNAIIFIFTIVMILVGAYYLYDYMYSKGKFESLMDTNSEAIFKRNQIELERLALKLSSVEEARVLEAMKRYRIR